MEELKRLRSRLHILLNERGLMDYKQDMLSAYGVTSSKQLTARQLEELIRNLDGSYQSTTYPNDHLRKKIISLFRTIAIDDVAKMKQIIVEKWGKPFNNYTKEEYQKIIAVLENRWIPYYLQKIQKDGTK